MLILIKPMRFLPTSIHGILDYLYGIAFIAAPKLFHLNGQSVGTITTIVGILVIVYSLFTNYELGLFKKIPVKVHLLFDFLGGAFLILCPLFFDFDHQSNVVFIAFGVFSIVASFITKTNSTIQTSPK